MHFVLDRLIEVFVCNQTKPNQTRKINTERKYLQRVERALPAMASPIHLSYQQTTTLANLQIVNALLLQTKTLTDFLFLSNPNLLLLLVLFTSHYLNGRLRWLGLAFEI